MWQSHPSHNRMTVWRQVLARILMVLVVAVARVIVWLEEMLSPAAVRF